MTCRRLLAGLSVGAAVAAAVLLRSTPTPAQPRPDLRPLAHWTFDADSVRGKTVADRAGKLPGTLLGGVLAADPPRLELDGPDDGVRIRPAVAAADGLFPKAALTAVAWVRVDEPVEYGGIVGCLQDNGPKEAGFLLGYDRKAFTFALASRGGVRLAVKDLDGDARADLVAGSGTGAGSRLTAYAGSALAGGDPPARLGLDAFAGFAGGVFVG